jgi:undecaprenyl-diphosphatase
MVSELVVSIILAIIQGITEWVPVSSSGHLVLFERIFGFNRGLEFDVALHFGTLMAVFVYFGKEICDIIKDFFSGKRETENGKMALYLIVASIPAAIVGYFAKDFFDSVLTDLRIVAFGFGITGVLLLISSLDTTTSFRKRSSRSQENYSSLGYKNALLIGIAQVLSIIPGISRSGATISTGVLLGLNEKNAMKFSFLMSIPIVFGANIISIGSNTLPSELIWATLVSFFVGLLSIHFLFKYVLVERKNFRWFGIYCLLLALGLEIYLLI